MPQLVVEVLGPWRITFDGEPVFEQAPAKWLALLAYLIVGHGERHTRAQIAALLWPDVPEALGKQNLRQLLFKARRIHPQAFAALLDIDGADLIVRQSPEVSADVSLFLNTPADKRGMPTDWGAAIALCRGEFLQDIAPRCGEHFDEWLTVTRARCERHVFALLGLLCSHLAARGDHEGALAQARRWIETDPLQESGYEHAARALIGLGRRSEAISVLESARHTLERELGIGLNATLQALARESRADTVRTEPDPGADLRPLPVARTPLVGRARELEGVLNLLGNDETRLVSIVGLGGSGKSRLALSIAHAALGRRLPFASEGVVFVPLVSSDGLEGIFHAIETALDATVFSGGDTERRVLNRLGRRCMLLVLDNFEHLARHASPLLTLLERAPGVKLLFTSRVPLNVYGEQLFRLDGLLGAVSETTQVVDDPHASIRDALSLFVQCARRVDPRFTMDEAGEAAAARICRLVSGMPLAIELSAAWVAGMTPEAIADSLEANIALLDEETPSAELPRPSMTGALEWSWERLSPELQAAFAQLSVFRGGFSPAAAQAVAGATPHELAALTKRLMLRFNPQHKPRGRYELLEVLRAFGAAQLDGKMRARAEAAHSRWYLDLARREAHKLESLDSEATQAELRLELDNLRVAWHHAVQRDDFEHLGETANAVTLIFSFWGYISEGEALLTEALAVAEVHGASPRVRALLLLHRAHTMHLGGRSQQALPDMLRALQPDSGIGEFDVARAEGAFMLARINHVQSRTAEATEAIELALKQARHLLHASTTAGTAAANDVARLRSVEIKALSWRGNIAFQVLDIPSARADLSEAVAVAQAADQAFAGAEARRGLGRMLVELGYVDEARTHLDKALAVFQRLRNPHSEFVVRQHRFRLCLHTWNLGAASDELRRSRRLLHLENQYLLLGFVGSVQCVLDNRIGDFSAAWASAADTRAAYASAGYTKGLGDVLLHETLIALRQGQLAAALTHADAAIEVAGRVRHHQTVEQVRIMRGRALLALGQLEPAKAAFAQARDHLLALHLIGFAAEACTGLAAVAHAQGDLAGAARALEPTFEPEMAQTCVVSADPVWQQWTVITTLRAAHDARAEAQHAQLRANLNHGLTSLPTPEARALFLAAPLVREALA